MIADGASPIHTISAPPRLRVNQFSFLNCGPRDDGQGRSLAGMTRGRFVYMTAPEYPDAEKSLSDRTYHA
ncbi:hypothetical protein C8J25_10678 [Sphingomonas faeni]|uniref:Uncharacterized protein n=1 Tax=Sphingomonas faeni TaxID=185950 RepID=A0A2T5U2S7_9SPHN|nr:hypothetical protein C8J25_10678 [Sphingomonas faeni]